MEIIEETETYRRVRFPAGKTYKLYVKKCKECGKKLFIDISHIQEERMCSECAKVYLREKKKGVQRSEEEIKKMKMGMANANRERKKNGIKKRYNRKKFKRKYGEASFNILYKGYRRNARIRNLIFDITKEEFKILTQQNCFYCNEIPLQSVTANSRFSHNGNYFYNGLDRIDNTKGYILDNIAPCCGKCNLSKRNMSKDNFLDLVKKIYEFKIKGTDIMTSNENSSKIPLTPAPPSATIHTMNSKTIEEKRDERRKTTGECFTPSWLVQNMIKKLSYYSKESFQDPTKSFLDPSAGDGNILIQVLKEKLANGHNHIQALSTIYGCDLMKDNVQICRLRLLKVLKERGIQLTIEHVKILKRNIVYTPNGSLDYLDLDEKDTFNDKMTDEQAKNALTKIIEGNKLSEVSIEEDPIPQIKQTKIDKPIKTKESKLKQFKPAMQGSIFDQFDDDPDFK